MVENNNNFGSSFLASFTCKICSKILHDPVQCQNNEHYFCRKCITEFLENSETCPLCTDQLSLETLRLVPRVILEILSQIKKPRCSNVSRGCKENVEVEELLLHEQTCGYAPVACFNEGCEETVNRQDKEKHEREECKFRKITCESCDEEMVYGDYEKHQCTLRREINEVKSNLLQVSESLTQLAAADDQTTDEINEVKSNLLQVAESLTQLAAADDQTTDEINEVKSWLDEVNESTTQLTATQSQVNEVQSRLNEVNATLKQVVDTQGELMKKLNAHDQSIKDLQNPLRHYISATVQRVDSTATITKGQIFIFKGKSLEVFNWSTRTWTLIKDCLFFPANKSFSFIYGKRIMLCSNGRIEFLNPSESGFISNVFPGSLPPENLNGVLFENRIISFGLHIQETSLERPWKSKILIEDDRQNRSNRSFCALERFGNDIFVIGYSGRQIERYNLARNQLTTLTSLPYEVHYMATVAYKDNIIIIGGQKSQDPSYGRTYYYSDRLTDVLMYNIHSLECKRLPSMLEKRSGHAAVIMGEVIVVMGGESKIKDQHLRNDIKIQLKSAEYYVIGDSTWQELPAMNVAAVHATACVYE